MNPSARTADDPVMDSASVTSAAPSVPAQATVDLAPDPTRDAEPTAPDVTMARPTTTGGAADATMNFTQPAEAGWNRSGYMRNVIEKWPVEVV